METVDSRLRRGEPLYLTEAEIFAGRIADESVVEMGLNRPYDDVVAYSSVLKELESPDSWVLGCELDQTQDFFLGVAAHGVIVVRELAEKWRELNG